MRIVKNKKELKEALAARETDIQISNKRLFKALLVANKMKKSWSHFERFFKGGSAKPEDLIHNAAFMQAVHTAGVVSETTIIIITIALLISAISIVALLKGYDAEIEVSTEEDNGGKLKMKYSKHKDR